MNDKDEMDWEKPFRPQDFCDIEDPKCTHGEGNSACSGLWNSEKANRRFHEFLLQCPRVLKAGGYGHMDSWVEPDKQYLLDATPSHEARLIAIREVSS